ncbi:MAG: dual specificity protein phosphatase family protein [Desertifilum sp. SIO1I2]|nr:dual specificity protein phosphatase family protein [Desertifilum sp. SIO1I2]
MSPQFWKSWVKRSQPQRQSSAVTSSSLLSPSWVLPGKLAVGRLPRVGEGERLAEQQIQVILSLCAEVEGTLPEEIVQNFRCLRYCLPDSHYATPMQVEDLAAVVDLVHQTVEQQTPLYIHCLAGMERSPTACIAYLCRYQGLELWEAMNWLKQVHPRTLPTEAQLRVIREYLALKRD